MIDQDEDIMKVIISRYQRDIFSLVLYLIGGDRDKAYDITAVSFVKAIQASVFLEKKEIFFIKLVKIAVEECQKIKVIPFSDDSDFIDLSLEEQKSLRIVKDALQLLDFDMKVMLLLRDQLHLSYKEISNVLGISEHDAKIQKTHAQSLLRKKIKNVMSHE